MARALTKQLLALLAATYDNSMPMSELFRLIGARLRDEKWIVSLLELPVFTARCLGCFKVAEFDSLVAKGGKF